VNDLKALLCKGSIAEQKSFLRSSIKRFEVNLPQIIIDYTIPPQKKRQNPSREKFYLLNILAPRVGLEPTT